MNKSVLHSEYQHQKREKFWCSIYGLKTFADVLNSKMFTLVDELAELPQGAKAKSMALEVVSVEPIGNCHMIGLRDCNQKSVRASFHPSCKEFVQKNVRKGRCLQLKDVGLFSITHSKTHPGEV